MTLSHRSCRACRPVAQGPRDVSSSWRRAAPPRSADYHSVPHSLPAPPASSLAPSPSSPGCIYTTATHQNFVANNGNELLRYSAVQR